MHETPQKTFVQRARLKFSVAIVLLVTPTQTSIASVLPLELIQLPPGFSIQTFATGVPNARAMALGDHDTLFVGSRSAGNVYALIDLDQDMRSDRLYIIAKGLHAPSGVAFYDDALYVSAVDRILRYDNIESLLEGPPTPITVTSALPKERHHGWKFIDFGPDGMLYVPVGAPCNVCLRSDPYAGILRMNPDGSAMGSICSRYS